MQVAHVQMLFHANIYTRVACNYSKSNAKVMMANCHLSVVQPNKISAYKVCVRVSAFEMRRIHATARWQV